MVYCIQAPTLVCLCQCEPCDDPEPHFDAVSFAVVDPDIFEHNFEYVLSSIKFSDNPDLQNPTSTHFLQDVTFRRNRRLGCDGQWVSKQQVEEWLPPPSAAAAAQPFRLQPKQLESEPWMTDPMMWEYIRDAANIKHNIAQNRARREEEDNSEQEEEAPMLILGEEMHALVTLWDRRAELA